MNAFLSGGDLILSAIYKLFYFLTYERHFEISCVNCTFKINSLNI